MRVVSLIVMEAGSRWPGHVRDSENIIAAGHEAGSLLERTRRTLALLDHRGQTVRVAVLACSVAVDATSVIHRAHVARALLDAVVAANSGRLVLSSVEGAPLQLRCELLSLAGTLSHVAPGAFVRVTFGDATAQDWVPRKCNHDAAAARRQRDVGEPSGARGASQQILG